MKMIEFKHLVVPGKLNIPSLASKRLSPSTSTLAWFVLLETYCDGEEPAVEWDIWVWIQMPLPLTGVWTWVKLQKCCASELCHSCKIEFIATYLMIRIKWVNTEKDDKGPHLPDSKLSFQVDFLPWGSLCSEHEWQREEKVKGLKRPSQSYWNEKRRTMKK